MEKWARQNGESYPAFEAFKEYLTERNYRKVAEKLSKSETLIKRWSKKNNWRERADAWDSEMQSRALEKASTEFASMVERQINIGRMFQAKAANAIQQMDFTNLPPKFLPSLIALATAGVKIERSARDLKIEEPQENIFVKTLSEIWEKQSDE